MARNSGVPVGYLSHFCSQLTCRWHWTPKAIWCWGFRLGAVELWFSRFRCLTFFELQLPELVVSLKALPHPKFYCQPWSFLALPAFLNFFFCTKNSDLFQKTCNFLRVCHSSTRWFFANGFVSLRGCVASVSLLEVLGLKPLLAAHLSIYFVTHGMALVHGMGFFINPRGFYNIPMK